MTKHRPTFAKLPNGPSAYLVNFNSRLLMSCYYCTFCYSLEDNKIPITITHSTGRSTHYNKKNRERYIEKENRTEHNKYPKTRQQKEFSWSNTEGLARALSREGPAGNKGKHGSNNQDVCPNKQALVVLSTENTWQDRKQYNKGNNRGKMKNGEQEENDYVSSLRCFFRTWVRCTSHEFERAPILILESHSHLSPPSG